MNFSMVSINPSVFSGDRVTPAGFIHYKILKAMQQQLPVSEKLRIVEEQSLPFHGFILFDGFRLR